MSTEDRRSDRGTADPLLIGLTGPIGCGKSTVAGWITDAGGIVVDADVIARAVTAPGQPGHDAVLARFGESFRGPDGSLDRAALGRVVFADPAALADLERIVHPLVRPRILAAVEAARTSGAPVVAVEAIRLIEGGYAAMCDEVWLVTCPADEQENRLIERGFSRADARQRARAQGGMTGRLAPRATGIIDTSGPAADVRRRVDELFADARAKRELVVREVASPEDDAHDD